MTLECETWNQTVERYLFFKDNLNLTCDQQRVTCNESSPFLQFQPIMTSDSGVYTCGIHNPVSSSTSRPLDIMVKVPISSVTLSGNGSSEYFWENEDAVVLTCSAQGTDPVYSWMSNGNALPQDSRYHLSADNTSLTISPVTRQDSGPFVCSASNGASSMSSNPLLLPITWRPSGQIRCSAEASGASQVLLQCSWPGGSPPALLHLKHPEINGTGTNEVTGNISQSNLLLGTEMSCYGNQEGHTQNCSLLFDVPNDPGFNEGAIVSATEGEDVSLEVNLKLSYRVTMVDHLPAAFRWFLNGSSSIITPDNRVTITTNVSFSQLTLHKVEESNNGEYFCLAENLMGTANFTFIVNITRVPETPTVTNQLSAGAIAGIVIGVVVLLVLIGITVFFIMRKSKDKVPRSEDRSNAGRPQGVGSLYSTVLEKVGDKDEPYYINVGTRTAVPRYETISPKPAEPRYETMFPKTAASDYYNTNVKKTPRA
ncbi:cell adhesion molecule CEACAM1-like isoform X2 [Lissotriton helveticus]